MTTTPTGEVIYEVEAQLDPAVVADFDAWLPGHVREVLACPGFLGAEIQAPLEQAPDGPALRRTQYRLEDMAALTRYLAEDAPRLRADATDRFGDKATFVRRLFTPAGVPLRLPETPVTCRNCGAPVPARYCPDCGQSRDVHMLSMHEVMGDVSHSLLHLDSRVWRTLRALVLEPGLLTSEFIAGRRQQYLPPFRLYLVVSVLFFALSALLPDGQWLHTTSEGEALIAFGVPPAGQAPAETGENAVAGSTADPERACDVDLAGTRLEAFEERFESACRKIQADSGRRLGEIFLGNVPRLMFLFLPLMAAVTMLFYWRPRRLYAEHLVMFLHVHSLLFLWLSLTAILEAASALDLPLVRWLGVAVPVLLLYVPWYVFRAMRVVYGNGVAATLAKFVTISLVYFSLLGLTFAAGMILSILLL